MEKVGLLSRECYLTKADLPTLAAPMTYTSRPLRSILIALTTSATPLPAAVFNTITMCLPKLAPSFLNVLFGKPHLGRMHIVRYNLLI